MTIDTRTEQHITVTDLTVGDELVYHDGNQVVTKIVESVDLNLRRVFDIYVDGVSAPRRQPGKAPVTVLR